MSLSSGQNSSGHFASIRFGPTTKDSLFLVQTYEPDFIAEVDRASCAKRPVYLQLNGYENSKEIVAACLWYALDHGVKVVVTTSAIEERGCPAR
jgi:hypothetical protein